MGDRSEEVGERGQMFPFLRRIVGLCNEKMGIFGPLSHLRSRFIHNPTASQRRLPVRKRGFRLLLPSDCPLSGSGPSRRFAAGVQ